MQESGTVYGKLRELLAKELESIRAAGSTRRSASSCRRRAPTIRRRRAARSSTSARTTTSGSRRPSRVVDGRARRRSTSAASGCPRVRFICGTQDLHKELEAAISRFLGIDDAILYSSCFDANGGLFETLLGEEDASSPTRSTTRRSSTASASARPSGSATRTATWRTSSGSSRRRARQALRLIATDGVFSMDGDIAQLGRDLRPRREVRRDGDGRRLARDRASSARPGRGTPEHCGVEGRVDVMTSTLGKALGGASGGFTARRARRSSTSCASARGRTSSRTRSRRRSWRRRSRRSTLLGATDRAARPARGEHEAASASGMTAAGFTIKPGRRTRSSRSCSATRGSPRTSRARCSTRASTSSASRTRSCRRARRASACSSRPPTRAPTSTARSTRSSAPARGLASSDEGRARGRRRGGGIVKSRRAADDLFACRRRR